MNSKIDALIQKLKLATSEVSGIEMELQAAYNEAFDAMPMIQKAVNALQESNDYTTDEYGEICQVMRWYELKDFEECKAYFTEYMRETHQVSIEWDNEALLYSCGPDNYIIQDDTRRDNGVWLEGHCVINESEYRNEDGEIDTRKRNKLIEERMQKTGYFPGVFRVDYHGNIFPVNTQD